MKHFDKLQHYQQDIESINAVFIEIEQYALTMLRQNIQELQENLQQENRQKMNSLTKLCQTEDLLHELINKLDDKESKEQHKLESKLIQLI